MGAKSTRRTTSPFRRAIDRAILAFMLSPLIAPTALMQTLLIHFTQSLPLLLSIAKTFDAKTAHLDAE